MWRQRASQRVLIPTDTKTNLDILESPLIVKTVNNCGYIHNRSAVLRYICTIRCTNMTKLNTTKSDLQEEAMELYRQYEIAIQDKKHSIESIRDIERNPEQVRTIKLSNSTTPMACI